uniref:HAUS augmin like complex subunit 5 n=1 Tax=Astyanax mexicanus TaxID=7994 RepID=A0A8B9HRT6_ASTMX
VSLKIILAHRKTWMFREIFFETILENMRFWRLCVGPGASIWKYVIKHLKQVEGQNKDAQRLQLQREIEELQAELSQLDHKISSAEDQLTNEEKNVGRHWELYEESRLRELMLDSFRQRCADERNSLIEDTQKISSQRQALDQLSKKAEVKLVFGSSDGGNTGMAAEPLVLRDIRELCNERVLFFRSLQDSMLKATSEFTPAQRNAAYQHWLSAVQDVLHSHPSNQVLLALQTLAAKQHTALEEKTAALDVEDDVSALGFRYESNHLLDVSMEEEQDLPPVRSLLQSAWEDVEQCYMQLTEVRSRARQLQADLSALMKQMQLRILGQDDDADPIASVFELEVQTVRQAAVRDSVREQCAQLQLQSRARHEALQSLQAQWQSIMDFRQLVDVRQEHIRSLIKANSTIKTELTRVHSELRQFVQENLSPQFGGVVQAATGLRNSVSQEGKQFNSVFLECVCFLLCETALLQRVKAEDAEVLQSLLPRVRELTQRCTKGLAFGNQVNTAIAHWWEQPGQFALPEMQQEGLTFQQWLQRWKLATKEI